MAIDWSDPQQLEFVEPDWKDYEIVGVHPGQDRPRFLLIKNPQGQFTSISLREDGRFTPGMQPFVRNKPKSLYGFLAVAVLDLRTCGVGKLSSQSAYGDCRGEAKSNFELTFKEQPQIVIDLSKYRVGDGLTD